MKKRAVSFAVILCIMMGLFPMTSIAAENNLTENPFSDVPENSYYYDAVLWAFETGITAGTSLTTFSPDNICTRGQVVTFLWRAVGCPEPTSANSPFEDVSDNAYYRKSVLWAVEMGITNGTSATTFSPNDYCTNAQVVTFLWRSNGSPASEKTKPHSRTENEYYAEAVSWADSMGLLSATDTTFIPRVYAPRSNIVTYLYQNSLNIQKGTFGEYTAKTSQIEKFNYLLYAPLNAKENMPLIIYLHGGSGKGNDLSLLTSNDGFPQYLKNGLLGEVPAYVLIPQMPSGIMGWINVSEAIYELVMSITEQYDIDAIRISLTGHSMGGTGTWEIARLYPDMFSCIAPLSGSIRTTKENLSTFSNLSIWAFVGEDDTIVSPDSSKQFISELKKTNASANITIIENATHFDVPSMVYLDTNTNLISWLTSTIKK